MAMAALVYTLIDKEGNRKSLTLDSASLKEIDDITRVCRNAYDVINSAKYKNKVDDFVKTGSFVRGNLKVVYTIEHDSRVTLPVIFNRKDEILLFSSTVDDKLSEVDKARKKLFSSKNNLYTQLFLNNPIMESTTMHLVRLDSEEYLYAKSRGLEPVLVEDDYRLSLKDILKFRMHNSKLRIFRPLFEDALEVWKSDLYSMDHEELYFYSRTLAVLHEEYLVKSRRQELIKNFKFDHKNLTGVITSRYKIGTLRGGTLNRVYTKTKKLQELA